MIEDVRDCRRVLGFKQGFLRREAGDRIDQLGVGVIALLLLEQGEKGNAYNVANRACTHSIREYAQALADIAGVGLTFDLPPEAEKAGYTKITRAVFDPSKLEALGWQPAYSLREGLEHTWLSLR